LSLLHAGFLLGLLVNPDDGGNMFLWNVGWLSNGLHDVISQKTDLFVSVVIHLKSRNKKFWEELIAYFPFIRHGAQRKRRVQQLIYWCVCIRCRGNVFTKPLPSSDNRTHIHTNTWSIGWSTPMRWAQVPWSHTHIEFHKYWLRHSKSWQRGTHRQHGNLINLLLIFSFKTRKVDYKTDVIIKHGSQFIPWSQYVDGDGV
jgi:hypothetical protein